MILKYKTQHEDGERWNFVDGIKETSIFFDKVENCTCVIINPKDTDSYLIALHRTSYLLNNDGKTIEKITL